MTAEATVIIRRCDAPIIFGERCCSSPRDRLIRHPHRDGRGDIRIALLCEDHFEAATDTDWEDQ